MGESESAMDVVCRKKIPPRLPYTFYPNRGVHWFHIRAENGSIETPTNQSSFVMRRLDDLFPSLVRRTVKTAFRDWLASLGSLKDGASTCGVTGILEQPPKTRERGERPTA